jgi:hypothetical protein
VWPQFPEHGQEIGGKPWVIRPDVGELYRSSGCLHRVARRLAAGRARTLVMPDTS